MSSGKSVSAGRTVRVGIISICFRDAAGLSETLDSIRAQTLDSEVMIEVVVVDGSEDEDTRLVFERFRAHSDIACALLSEPDRGVYDAMNKGARALADIDYYHFLNSGDTFRTTDAIVWVAEAARKGLSPEWIVAGAYHGFGTGREVARIPNMPHRLYRHAYGLQPHCHQACWFRSDVFDILRGYDERFGLVSDFDLVLRFALRSRPYEITRSLIFYEGGGVSAEASHSLPGLIAKSRRERLYVRRPFFLRFDSVVARGVCVYLNCKQGVSRWVK